MSGGEGRTTPLGPGREFDLIRSMLARWGPRARGIGDDAALVKVPAGAQLVVSTDASLEGTHFREGWFTPEEIGYRATMAALSDLAAMAAEPVGILLALAMPERWLSRAEALADGVGAAAEAAGAPIVGGDLSKAEQLSIVVTVLGAADRPLTRSGAGVGDRLFVTGALGAAGAALAALLEGRDPSADARARLARPAARLREARWLARQGASSAIDLSDGLAADLSHVAHASNVRMVVELDRLPTAASATPLEAAASGEEYELVVTSPSPLDVRGFARELGVSLTEIGRVERGDAGVELFEGGKRVASPRGYDHFSH